MSTALISQIDEFNRTLDSTVRDLTGKMQSGLDKLSGLPIPAHYVQPYVDRWNGAIADLNTNMAAIGPGLRIGQVMCMRLMTIREAGEAWRDEIADPKANPFAQSLSRTELDGSEQFSWKSAAVTDYWAHIDGNKETATKLAETCTLLSTELLNLADAIDKQNSDLGWAIAGAVGSIVGLVGAGIGLGVAVGALAGLPAGGVGAIPGAVLGGLIGAILGLVGAIIGLAASIKAWVDATKVVGSQGAASMQQVNNQLAALGNQAWPAPHDFGSGSDYQDS